MPGKFGSTKANERLDWPRRRGSLKVGGRRDSAGVDEEEEDGEEAEGGEATVVTSAESGQIDCGTLANGERHAWAGEYGGGAVDNGVVNGVPSG